MILTAGFHDDSGLKLCVKIKWSNTTMFMVKCLLLKTYCENEKWRRNIYGTSFRTRGFGENLDDFWRSYCRAMKRNWTCVTCRPFFWGLSCFSTAERKGKFTCWGSDFFSPSSVSSIAPCKGIHDSLGFWIPPCGFRIASTGFRIPAQWIPDSKKGWIPNFFLF